MIINELEISIESACPKVNIVNNVANRATPPNTVTSIITIEYIKNVNAVTSKPASAPLLGEVAIIPATNPPINQATIENTMNAQAAPTKVLKYTASTKRLTPITAPINPPNNAFRFTISINFKIILTIQNLLFR